MFDLIGALTSEMGVQASQARAIAGCFLRYLSSSIETRFGEEDAREFESYLPHWSEWQASKTSPGHAPLPPGIALGVDARLAEILGELGLDPVQTGLALPAIVTFLKANVPSDVLRQVYAVAPFITGAAPEARTPGYAPISQGPGM